MRVVLRGRLGIGKDAAGRGPGVGLASTNPQAPKHRVFIVFIVEACRCPPREVSACVLGLWSETSSCLTGLTGDSTLPLCFPRKRRGDEAEPFCLPHCFICSCSAASSALTSAPGPRAASSSVCCAESDCSSEGLCPPSDRQPACLDLLLS